uniref:Uncharacterized protein n=1 Tax=Oryza glaberrima TaxID=4538 RepID=I1QXC9_ORYGL
GPPFYATARSLLGCNLRHLEANPSSPTVTRGMPPNHAASWNREGQGGLAQSGGRVTQVRRGDGKRGARARARCCQGLKARGVEAPCHDVDGATRQKK